LLNIADSFFDNNCCCSFAFAMVLQQGMICRLFFSIGFVMLLTIIAAQLVPCLNGKGKYSQNHTHIIRLEKNGSRFTRTI
jgi:hypothetical protein